MLPGTIWVDKGNIMPRITRWAAALGAICLLASPGVATAEPEFFGMPSIGELPWISGEISDGGGRYVDLGLCGSAPATLRAGGDELTLVAVGGGTDLSAADVVNGALVGGTIGAAMDAYDQRCVGRVLELGADHEAVVWHNQTSDTAYRVVPVKTFERVTGLVCRVFAIQATTSADSQAVYQSACRQMNGSWTSMI